MDKKSLWKSLVRHPLHLIGWDRKPQFEVLIALIQKDNKWNFLFQKRAADIRQGGELCFPGGHREEGEKPGQTALRETSEELGISESSIDVFGYFGTILTRNGNMVHAYLGEIQTSVEDLHPQESEVERVFTYPVSFFKENPPEELEVESLLQFKPKNGRNPVTLYGLGNFYNENWRGHKTSVWVWTLNEGSLWGLTAELVREVLKNLE